MMTQDNEAVQHFFTRNAMDYSKLFLKKASGNNFAFRERLTVATQMTSDISGRLLDCACGSGEITSAILGSGRFTSAMVVDLSPRMLELARQHLATDLKTLRMDRLDFKSMDIFELAAQPQSEKFDLILCLGLIAHTGRLDDLLARLKGLLNPRGKILLQSSLLDHGGMKIVRAFTNRRYQRRYGYRLSYFHHQDILKAARDAGFEASAVRRFTFGFPFGDRVWPKMNYRLERKMQDWARQHGAEAIYLLGTSSARASEAQP
jgi:2-polyprenyl-3-methyl-5-hydroxy-6-metoxy-1,4-benzoquinol methylase